MLPIEILKKVKRIEIRTKHLVEEVFSGEYHSIFKGRGMEFEEVREYQAGDDVKLIDWNVTARYGYPFIKKFREERELTVVFLVDASFSGLFGTARNLKYEMAAEITAVLAFSAIRNNDKVGMVIFTDKIEKFIPPQKGRYHVLRLIREVLFFKSENRKTDLGLGLEFLSKVLKRKSIIFIISDFLSSSFEKALRLASKKHDIIVLKINDPREFELPEIGLLELYDAEEGQQYLIDTLDKNFIRNFSNSVLKREENLKRLLDSMQLLTDSSYIKPLIGFFRWRAKKFR